MSEETISPQEEKGRVGTAHAESNEDIPQSSVTSPHEEKPQPSIPTFLQDAPKLEASATLKTRSVRPPRGNISQVLHGAAKKAAHSNSRNDVHEYMRLRRSYV